jgi:hypothetical protein
MGELAALRSDDGILFDDFVEQTFCYSQNGQSHAEPWIGVFHHPHNMPDVANHKDLPQVMLETRTWLKSEDYLCGAIVMSEYLGEFYRGVLPCPVVVVRHPVGTALRQWSRKAWMANPVPSLIQAGAYLRNTRAIDQVPSHRLRRVKLVPKLHWLTAYDRRVGDYWLNGNRAVFDGVETVAQVSAFRYDELLASNVILSEVFDASANNVTLDCIARHTPLAINPHPAVVEYLGEAYPLYFDEPKSLIDLLTDENIFAAHEYLRELDKSPFSGEAFRGGVKAALDLFASDGSR